MTVELNHTIVAARDKLTAAAFLTDLLGLPAPTPVRAVPGGDPGQRGESGIHRHLGRHHPQHYAFLVSESDFDVIFGRIRALDLPYWADPAHHEPSEINTRDGGRGVYFDDPNGHVLELITRPYGSDSAS